MILNKDGTRNLRELRKEVKKKDYTLSDDEVLKLWLEGAFPPENLLDRSLQLIREQVKHTDCFGNIFPVTLPKPLTLEEKLDLLRQEWLRATPERRKEIELLARKMKGETIFQCYFVDENGVRCTKEQADCWCSPEHKKIWQEKQYGADLPRGERKKLAVFEIQAAFHRMGLRMREVRLNK